MTSTIADNRRLLDDFGAGKKPALARAVSIVENHREGFDDLLAALHPRLGRARRVGITGPPGAGKSTFTARLTAAYRRQGATVGIVAVDPTSPFTGGALLGDRIRMESVALDPGVFIRSMATRGSLGGLAEATGEVADVLDAFGMDRILIETVGVGQSELDVSRHAETTVVVLVPESGDSIQTLKAGLMEIADIFVVNKSDRPGADRMRNELEVMIAMRSGESLRHIPAHHGTRATKSVRAAPQPPDGSLWTPSVLSAVAIEGTGIDQVVEAIDLHVQYLESTGELRRRRRARLRRRVVQVVESRVRQRLWTDAGTDQWLDDQLAALEGGTMNPFEVADSLLVRSAQLLTRS